MLEICEMSYIETITEISFVGVCIGGHKREGKGPCQVRGGGGVLEARRFWFFYGRGMVRGKKKYLSYGGRHLIIVSNMKPKRVDILK